MLHSWLIFPQNSSIETYQTQTIAYCLPKAVCLMPKNDSHFLESAEPSVSGAFDTRECMLSFQGVLTHGAMDDGVLTSSQMSTLSSLETDHN